MTPPLILGRAPPTMTARAPDGTPCSPQLAHERLELRTGPDGRLVALLPHGRSAPVRLVRCFPWSAPTRLISLRDETGDEVAFVEDLHQLDPTSQRSLQDALVATGFVLRVTAIEEVSEDFEIRRYRVMTAQGPRSFQTARDVWPRETPTGELLLEDVGGDLLLFPQASQLDKRSQRLLWAIAG